MADEEAVNWFPLSSGGDVTFFGGPGCQTCGTQEHLEYWGHTQARVVQENQPSPQSRSRLVNRMIEPHIDGYRCRQCGREFGATNVSEDWPPEGAVEIPRP